MTEKEDISYEEPPKKPTPAVMDAETEALKQTAYEKIQKAQIDAKVRAEAGLSPLPEPAESVPKELPLLIFRSGANLISCEKFNIDETEAKMIAKHLSNLIGAVNSKWYSLFIIVVILISKIAACKDAVKNLFKKKQKDEAAATA